MPKCLQAGALSSGGDSHLETSSTFTLNFFFLHRLVVTSSNLSENFKTEQCDILFNKVTLMIMVKTDYMIHNATIFHTPVLRQHYDHPLSLH